MLVKYSDFEMAENCIMLSTEDSKLCMLWKETKHFNQILWIKTFTDAADQNDC